MQKTLTHAEEPGLKIQKTLTHAKSRPQHAEDVDSRGRAALQGRVKASRIKGFSPGRFRTKILVQRALPLLSDKIDRVGRFNSSLAKIYTISRTQWVPKPLNEVFDFFSRPANLQELTPPLLDFHILEAPEQIRAGSLIRYRLRVHKVPVNWTTEIVEWKPPLRFVDIQLKGPYTLWRHQHTFAVERGGTTISDRVSYSLPLGPLGQIVHALIVRRDVEQIFEFRSVKMQELFGTKGREPAAQPKPQSGERGQPTA